MKYPTAALSLIAARMFLNSNMTLESSADFHLPDIPESERIKTHSPKGFRRGRKRNNKLHCRRKK